MTANADIPVGDGERRHDPMLDVLTRYHGCRACGIVKDTGRAHSEYGKYEDQGPYYVLFSDLPALIARVREDERAAALRDAAEAVKALDLQSHYRMTCEPPDPVDWSKHRSCDAWADIVAAIEVRL